MDMKVPLMGIFLFISKNCLQIFKKCSILFCFCQQLWHSVPVSIITLTVCDVQKNKVHWGWVLKIIHSLPTQMRENALAISIQIFNTGGKKRGNNFHFILLFLFQSAKGNIAVFCDFFRAAIQFHLHPISAYVKGPVVSWNFSMSFNLNVLSVFALVPFYQLSSLILPITLFPSFLSTPR